MTLADLTEPAAVVKAIDLYDELGQDEFLSRFSFGPSRRYILVHRSRSYDSKAIAGVAHGFQFPAEGPLRSADFSGGLGGAASKLASLGFEIRDQGAQHPGPAVIERREAQPPPNAVTGDVVALVGCVKGKQQVSARAVDLYTSDLFKKRRDYVTQRGMNWFILSAQHGLVAPSELLEPYDMALKDQPASYQREWGKRVVAQLGAQLGPLAGMTFEIHAGAAYVDGVTPPLLARGGTIATPLKGLTQGQQLAWYRHNGLENRREEPQPTNDPVAVIGDGQLARPCAEFPWGRNDLARPGLYSWWVDESGATDLSRGLGLPLGPGLVYLGQTGATSGLIGRQSAGTLRSRVGQHLNGGVKASTWRRTLAALLVGSGPIDEQMVSAWMRRHLSLIVCPEPRTAVVLDLERRALRQFDPPLNLEGMDRTPIRIALTALRSDLALRLSSNPLRP